jgi:hypothetical protein
MPGFRDVLLGLCLRSLGFGLQLGNLGLKLREH